MKPEMLDLRASDDPRDLVHRIVERLATGGLVALPTETVYAVAAGIVSPGAMERLWQLHRRCPSDPVALCVKSFDEGRDWVSTMSPLEARLARRCWPGPVTLGFAARDGLLQQVDITVRRRLCGDDWLYVRAPAHAVLLDCQRLLPWPLAVTGVSDINGSAASSGEDAATALSGCVDLVLDDGPCRYGQPATVVRVQRDQWEITREGVVSTATIEKMGRTVILFVCTGNTCRSPMAEAIFRRLLADRLSCSEAELPNHNYEVLSAGIAATSGMPASREAVGAAQARGARLDDHQSHLLTREDILQADWVFAMTASHQHAILEIAPEAARRVRLLRRDGGSIADPIGGDSSVYSRCADEIEEQLRQIVEELHP